MANCCEDKSCEITVLREKHGPVLKIVLIVNALMFVAESVSGWRAHSTSLIADSLDMFGDAKESRTYPCAGNTAAPGLTAMFRMSLDSGRVT